MKRKKAWGSPADTSGHCDSSSMDTRRIYAIRLYIWWRMMLQELRRGPMRQKPAHTNPVATHLHTNLVSLRSVQFGVKKAKSGFMRRLRGVRKWIRGAMRQRTYSVWKIRVNMLVETENQINTERILSRKTMQPHVHWAKTTAILQFVILGKDTFPALEHWW